MVGDGARAKAYGGMCNGEGPLMAIAMKKKNSTEKMEEKNEEKGLFILPPMLRSA